VSETLTSILEEEEMKKIFVVAALLLSVSAFSSMAIASENVNTTAWANDGAIEMSDLDGLIAYHETGTVQKCGFRDAKCHEVKCDNGSRVFYYYNSSKGKYCTGTTFESCMSNLDKLLRSYCGE
jgi:hypothetical protein